MAETPDNPQPQQPASTWPRPIPRFALVLIGSLCTAIGSAVAAKDVCWAPIASGFMAAVIITLADMIVLVPMARHFSWGRKVTFLAVTVIVCTIVFMFRLDARYAFRVAFGQDPPSSVANLTVDSGLHLGPDQTYLIRFTADQATIDQVLAARPFRTVRETTEGYPQERDWNSVWQRLFGGDEGHGGAGWQNVEPMKRPMHFEWENTWPQEVVDVLWDAESGRAYARYGTL